MDESKILYVEAQPKEFLVSVDKGLLNELKLGAAKLEEKSAGERDYVKAVYYKNKLEYYNSIRPML